MPFSDQEREKPMIRMTRSALLLLAAAVGCATARTSSVPSAAQIRPEIEAAIAHVLRIAERGDADAYDAAVAPDFSVRTLNGTMIGRDSVLARARRRWAQGVSTAGLAIVVDSLRVEDARAAIVFTTQRFVRTLPGEGGRTHRVETSVEHRERWVRRDGRWQVIHIAELRQGPTLVDGVPRPRPDARQR
jgi:hypothetical protein